MITIKVKINDAKLRRLIRENPKIGTEMIREGAKEGARNTQVGLMSGRPEWDKLSDRRIAEKGHAMILLDTLNLVKSIRYGANGKLAWYGTDVEYAGIHELGLLEPEVPRRPFLIPTIEGGELQSMIDKMVNFARMRYMI